MAGAGGLFLVLVGGLLGVVAGALAIALFLFGSRMRPARSRAATYAAGIVAIAAVLLMAPAWLVVVTGKDTRGEPFDYGTLDLTFYVFFLTPPITLLALVTRLVRRGPVKEDDAES
jgi:hypothetical protein